MAQLKRLTRAQKTLHSRIVKTGKYKGAPQKDLDALEAHGLISRTSGGYVLKKDNDHE